MYPLYNPFSSSSEATFSSGLQSFSSSSSFDLLEGSAGGGFVWLWTGITIEVEGGGGGKGGRNAAAAAGGGGIGGRVRGKVEMVGGREGKGRRAFEKVGKPPSEEEEEEKGIESEKDTCAKKPRFPFLGFQCCVFPCFSLLTFIYL